MFSFQFVWAEAVLMIVLDHLAESVLAAVVAVGCRTRLATFEPRDRCPELEPEPNSFADSSLPRQEQGRSLRVS